MQLGELLVCAVLQRWISANRASYSLSQTVTFCPWLLADMTGYLGIISSNPYRIMKRVLLMAALLGGVSFSSLAADNESAANLISSKNVSTTVTTEPSTRPRIFTKYIFKAQDWYLSACGHNEHFVGEKADAAEYMRWMINTYCWFRIAVSKMSYTCYEDIFSILDRSNIKS